MIYIQYKSRGKSKINKHKKQKITKQTNNPRIKGYARLSLERYSPAESLVVVTP